MEKIPMDAIQSLPLFQKETMSYNSIMESIKWTTELLEKANNGCWESRVDYIKYQKEGLPKRFFDKREFDPNLICEFNKKYNLNLIKFHDEKTRPCYFLHGTGYDTNEGEVLFYQQLEEYKNNQ